MNKHRYILEPYKGKSTRYTCPICKEKRSFALYIDTEIGKHIAPDVGRCNRESNCGHHYPPKQYFEDNNIKVEKENIIYQYKDEIIFEFEYSETVKDAVKNINGCKYDATLKQWYIKNSIITEQIKNLSKKHNFNIIEYTPSEPLRTKQVSFITVEIFKQSLKDHNENNFVKFLINLFGVEVTSELISKYFIGTSKHWNDATVFWQIDLSGKIRTGKIMLYNPATGKRVKEPYKHINWVHTVLKLPEFNLQQCLFGEHLLQYKTKPIAIVESEKTALIASVYLPQFIWLAVGSLNNLNAEKCSVLKGRTVALFPDLNGFEKWSNKAKELSNIAIFTVSDLLERKATEAERKQGLDLADYLIRFDYIVFQQQKQPEHQQNKIEQPQPKEIAKLPEIKPAEKINYFTGPETPKSESWDKEINELEKFFKSIKIPAEPIKLNQCTTILNVSNFIESHIYFIKAQNRKQTYLPYLNRLIELKKYLTLNLN